MRGIGSKLKDHFTASESSAETQVSALIEIKTSIKENMNLISSISSIGPQLLEGVIWIKNLGKEFKDFMQKIIAENISIYHELVVLRILFASRVDSPLCEDPICLEDAIGRIAPVYLWFISSWEAFDAVMDVRFQRKPGFLKIRRKEYVIEKSATSIEVDRSVPFDDALYPEESML